MTAEEYGLWMAWHRREPLDAGWWQTGMVASTIANVNRGKNSEPFMPAQFIPECWAADAENVELDPMEFVKRNHG